MTSYRVLFAETFFEDITEIVQFICEKTGSKESAKAFYEAVFEKIKSRAVSADSYETYVPYQGAPDYYRLYYKSFIIFYVLDGDCMDVRRIMWAGSDIPNRI